MIWLDVILLSPLLWGAYTGFKKGLVAQILGIISLLAGVWIGTHFQDLIEPFIAEKVQEKYLSTLSFIILFFITIIAGAIITKIIEKFINFVQLKLLNKIAGVVLGMIKILSFLVIIIFILESWDTQSFIIKKTTKNCKSYQKRTKKLQEFTVVSYESNQGLISFFHALRPGQANC